MVEKKGAITITMSEMKRIVVRIQGTQQLVIERFSTRQREKIREKHEMGSAQAGKKKTKDPRDFERDYSEARYISADGWDGIHCSAFRNAMVSACGLLGIKMTMAKKCLFIVADGCDKDDGSWLTRIIGEPEMFVLPTRNDTGVSDLRARPRYLPGWECFVTVEFDGGVFAEQDVRNLMARVGRQIGVGAGRYDSKDSCGQGWGCFQVI